MRQLIAYLYFLLRGLNKLDAVNATVYRGIPSYSMPIVQEKYQEGYNIHWSGFTSTSPSLKVTQKFAGQGGLIMRISIRTGRSIKPYSAIQGEAEILLAPNTKMIVTKKVHLEGDGYHYIDMLEVAQSSDFVF